MDKKKFSNKDWDTAPTDGLADDMRRRIRLHPLDITPKRRPDSAKWQARGTVLGKLVRKSTGTGDPAKAWLFCIELGDFLYEHRLGRNNGGTFRQTLEPPPQKKTLAWAVEQCIAMRTVAKVRSGRGAELRPQMSEAEQVKLRRAATFFPEGTILDDIGQERLDEIAIARWAKGCSNTTLAREHIGPIKALLRYGSTRRWCVMPMLDQVPQWEPLKDWLTPSDVTKLCTVSKESDGEIWEICAMYGHHLSELTRLTRGDVDLRYGRITVNTKAPNGKVYVRRSPLLPRARVILERLLALPGEPTDQLFQRADSSPLGDGASAESYIGRRLEEAKVLAGMKRRFTHRSFRSLMATWMLSATDGAMKTVMVFGGWRTTRMVDAYSDVIDSAIVPDIIAFYGLPSGVNLVRWLGLPNHDAQDASLSALRKTAA